MAAAKPQKGELDMKTIIRPTTLFTTAAAGAMLVMGAAHAASPDMSRADAMALVASQQVETCSSVPGPGCLVAYDQLAKAIPEGGIDATTLAAKLQEVHAFQAPNGTGGSGGEA